MARLDPRRHVSSRDLGGNLGVKVSDLGPKNLSVSGSTYVDGTGLYFSPSGMGAMQSMRSTFAGLCLSNVLGNSGSNTQSENYMTASVLVPR